VGSDRYTALASPIQRTERRGAEIEPIGTRHISPSPTEGGDSESRPAFWQHGHVKPTLRFRGSGGALATAVHCWRTVGTGLVVASVCCTYAGRAYAQESSVVPVLSVCEALRGLELYRGKTVVIVARAGITFEGSFMDEQCEADARILIQGHRWPSMIQLSSSPDKAARAEVFPVDEALLRAKLTQISSLTEPVPQVPSTAAPTASPGVQAVDSRYTWVAAYGRIECPARLKQHLRPSRSYPHNFVGNGYGANGSVPARIEAIGLVSVVHGQDELTVPWRPPQRVQPPIELSEPPLLPMPFAAPSPPPVLPMAMPTPPV
jgi:hypothetical protein